MKQFFKMFFASLLAMVVAGIIVVVILIGSITALVSRSISEKETKVSAKSVLVIDLSDKLHEQGQSNSFAGFSGDAAYEAGLYDVMRCLSHAKSDDNIKGLVIKLNSNANGWATSQQLRLAIADFKKSGKFVYAYGEMITQGAYFVATAADSIYLNPVGNMELKGFATVIPFFKGTLDKLEIQPEIYYAGKFKSATEPFRAEKISDPNREQIMAYQSGIWNEFISAVSQHTGKTTDEINQLAQNGAIQFPKDALDNKIVDGLLYWDQLDSRIRKMTNLNDTETIRFVKMDEYASAHRRDTKISDQRIAVLFAEGDIVDGEKGTDVEIASRTLVDEIRKLKNNPNIKAVVLRVNSPGGSAMASDIILRELDLLKQKKPLVVSMGDYAASGGYYISCHADSIFAMPNTITGSIGVFSILFTADKLMKDKLGVNVDEVKNAPFADFPTATRPLNEEEAKRMQASVDNIYGIFKGHVSEGRKIAPADVDSIAQGRVWTGTDALKIHLVDAMGGLGRAISSAASLAKVSDYKVVTYPEPEDKFQNLIRRFKGNTAMADAVKASLKKEVGTGYEWLDQLTMFRKMNGKALMSLPYIPVIK
jgi:protease-4